DTSMFFNTHHPDTLICYGVPTSLPVDGATKAVVTVTGYDLNDSGAGFTSCSRGMRSLPSSGLT
ncbi:MAG: hypothetical protein PHU88_09295, partial [candidate division Zixibacteria bacterium]|nr:hypothetical protein [candidate division Zixibacteria bacterium]